MLRAALSRQTISMLAHAAGWLTRWLAAWLAGLVGRLTDSLSLVESERERESTTSFPARIQRAAGLVKDVRLEGVFDPVKFPFSTVKAEDVGCEKRIARGKTHDR